MEHERSKVGLVPKKCKAKQEQIEMVIPVLRAKLVPKEIAEQINDMEEPTAEPTDKPAQLDKPKDEPKKSMNETTNKRIYETKIGLRIEPKIKPEGASMCKEKHEKQVKHPEQKSSTGKKLFSMTNCDKAEDCMKGTMRIIK
eukprot:6524554-Ditylum_brightwellii.AAC.1